VFSRGHEVSKPLVLLSRHCAISTFLQSQVLLKVGIEVLLEGQVADKSHATDAAVELDSVEILGLGSFAKSKLEKKV